MWDLLHPTISDVSLSQIEEIDTVELSLHIRASDNNQIQKIRFVYQQGMAWRSQTAHYTGDLDEFDIQITGLENVDSKVLYFVEIQDEYGNIETSIIPSMIVHSTIIPYITIGIGIGLAVAVASIVAVVYRKRSRTGKLEGVSFDDSTEDK